MVEENNEIDPKDLDNLNAETEDNQNVAPDDTTDLGNSLDDKPINQEELIAKLQEEHEALKDKYLRLFAEFDNYKKRKAKEQLELIQSSNKTLLSGLLEIKDDFERGAGFLENATDIDAVKDGITMIFDNFSKFIEKQGVQEIEAKGLDFNPETHEAITEIEAGEEMKGKIVDVVVKGYTLNQVLLRFPKVVVGK
ncbi:MAG: nucleotide exchange factor GrpE [Chitinophagales bacterium]|jgi:molecular chaperone GrpE|nr:nucleotide exchange factor GrpE [Chitinophagales bacterium]